MEVQLVPWAYKNPISESHFVCTLYSLEHDGCSEKNESNSNLNQVQGSTLD